MSITDPFSNQPFRPNRNIGIRQTPGTKQEQKNAELQKFIDDVAAGATITIMKKRFSKEQLSDVDFRSRQMFIIKPQIKDLLTESNNSFAIALLEGEDIPGVRVTHEKAIEKFVKYAEPRLKIN
jgi:hypothetical protein